MKKKKLKNLNLNKKSISDFSNTSKGGAEVSERRSNCDYCSPEPAEPAGCYTEGDLSCGIICMLTDPYYSLVCSRN